MARLLCIGDIHGCFRSLTTLERFVPFHKEDRIVTLGDYVDRGPNSYAVLDWLIYKTSQEQLTPLLGNHEQLMLEARDDTVKLQRWIKEGGDTTLSSYSPFGDKGSLVDVPDTHWTFLETECEDWHETESHIFVHASLRPELDPKEQPIDALRWEKFDTARPHKSGKTVICGHTAQKTGFPNDKEFAICIDTWVYGRGWLTCLDVASYEYWQANETGHTRSGRLR